MPKPCTGTQTNTSDLMRESRSSHRAQGTAVAFPVTDNPHAAASDAGVAWIAGWDLAEAAAGGTVTASDASCCAVPQNTIAA